MWGDAKVENVLIREHRDAGLIDFGGRFSDSWVKQRYYDTEHGGDLKNSGSYQEKAVTLEPGLALSYAQNSVGVLNSLSVVSLVDLCKTGLRPRPNRRSLRVAENRPKHISEGRLSPCQ